MKITNVMSKTVSTITQDKSVLEAATIMSSADHGMLVVVDPANDKNVVGVISDRDILTHVTCRSREPASMIVAEIMEKNIVSIESNQNVSEAALLMAREGRKRLIVMFQGDLVGVISSTDILQSVKDTKRELLDMALKF